MVVRKRDGGMGCAHHIIKGGWVGRKGWAGAEGLVVGGREAGTMQQLGDLQVRHARSVLGGWVGRLAAGTREGRRKDAAAGEGWWLGGRERGAMQQLDNLRMRCVYAVKGGQIGGWGIGRQGERECVRRCSS